MKTCKDIKTIKHLQNLAIAVFNREIPGTLPLSGLKPGHEGVVLFTSMDEPKCYGWKNELRNPEHEAPGAVAIDFYGNIWVAVGGNDYDGAEQWELHHKQQT